MISFALGSILSLHSFALLLAYFHEADLIEVPFLDRILPARKILTYYWLTFVIFLCIFHLAEFIVTACYNPRTLTADSFLINHSKHYTIAILLSCVEFWSRFTLFPVVNSVTFSFIGLFLVILGQSTRWLAMQTCGESFNHIIQSRKKENHILVTTGIYRYLRHPSYFGFYYWAVGTQIFCGNIISSILFAVASWMFFQERIPYEEKTLMEHFPHKYPSYIKQSYIGIPFIASVKS